jgi:hypothetical protein
MPAHRLYSSELRQRRRTPWLTPSSLTWEESWNRRAGRIKLQTAHNGQEMCFGVTRRAPRLHAGDLLAIAEGLDRGYAS